MMSWWCQCSGPSCLMMVPGCLGLHHINCCCTTLHPDCFLPSHPSPPTSCIINIWWMVIDNIQRWIASYRYVDILVQQSMADVGSIPGAYIIERNWKLELFFDKIWKTIIDHVWHLTSKTLWWGCLVTRPRLGWQTSHAWYYDMAWCGVNTVRQTASTADQQTSSRPKSLNELLWWLCCAVAAAVVIYR